MRTACLRSKEGRPSRGHNEFMPSKNKKKNKSSASNAVAAPAVAQATKKVEAQQPPYDKENALKQTAVVDSAFTSIAPVAPDDQTVSDSPSNSVSSETFPSRKPLEKKIEPPPVGPGKSADAEPSKASLDMFDPQSSTELGLDSTPTVSLLSSNVDSSEAEKQNQTALERIKLEEVVAVENEKVRKEEETGQKQAEEMAKKQNPAVTVEEKKKKEKELAEKEKERVAKEAIDRAKAAEALAKKTEKEADEAEAKLKEAQDKFQLRLKEKEGKALAERVAAASAAGKNKAQAAIARAKEAAQKLKDPKKDPRIGGGSATSVAMPSSSSSSMMAAPTTASSASSSASLVTPQKQSTGDGGGAITVGSMVKTPYGIGKVINCRENGMMVIKPSSWSLANDCTPTFYMMKNPPRHTPAVVEIGVGTPADIPKSRTAASTPESPGNKNCICF